MLSLAQDLYQFRDLIGELVLRDLRVRYRRSAIGFLWSMLQPLLTMLVLQMVFAHIFQVRMPDGAKIRNFPVYALSGILFWNFFSQSIITSMNSLKGNAYLLQKLPVPTGVFPVTAVISGVVNLVLALVPLAGILLYTGHPIGPSVFFLPVAILIITAFTLGMGFLLSPLAVFFSDVIELVMVVLTLAFYLTPVFYPKEMLADTKFYWVVFYSPIRSILEVFRDPIYLNKIPPVSHLSLATALALLALVIGGIVFHRSSHRIPFYV
nr:O-antigen export system permease protein RfbA-like [Nerophis lumbriciformis]